MTNDRREFLKKMAAGAAFAVPTVRSIVVPARLAAQSTKGGGGDMDKTTMGMLVIDPANSSVAPGSTAPWNTIPPGGGGEP